uniref:Sulfatase N-terminal domain-containing protein n=1 Tax=Desulfobacca acetoxidans TaxID=60893 RepID=A0A7V4G7Q1_9BACT
MSATMLPNIIIIVMDTAGAKRCSTYGHHLETTPGLSRIAREGTLYRRSFAPSTWTVPSHASLFSGLYPSEHGIDGKTLAIPENLYSLPEVLQQMGYRTAAISCNGLANFMRGFDVFYEMDTLFKSEKYQQDRFALRALHLTSDSELTRFRQTMQYIFEHHSYSFPLKNIIDRLFKKHFTNLYYRTWKATNRSFNIASHLFKQYCGKQPLFIFMNLMESHWKYNPPLEYSNIIKTTAEERKKLLNYDVMDYYIKGISPDYMEKIYLLYQQALWYLDKKLYEFYQALGQAGVRDQTMFAATSDHGEALGERGVWGHLFGVYNETIHVPLVVKYPAGVREPGEDMRLAQLNDLFATALEMIGVPLPLPDSSRSLLGPPRDYAFAEHYRIVGLEAIQKRVPDYPPAPYMLPSRTVISDDLFKLIEWSDGRLELYDLNRDWHETENLADRPEQAERIRQLSRVLLEKFGPIKDLVPQAAKEEIPDYI